MNTSVRNLMMGFMLAGSMLVAIPVSAQMSNHRRPSGNDATMSSSRSHSSSDRMQSRSSSAGESRSHDNRSAQSMNTGRQRPSESATTRREAVAPKNDRPSGGGSYGNDRRPGGDRPNGDRPGSNMNNNRRPGGDRPGSNMGSGNNRPNGDRPGGSSYGNDRRPGSNNYGNDRRPGSNNHGNDRRPGGNSHASDHRPGGHVSPSHRPDHHGDRGYHAYRDHYSWNHAHHNWSRPLPPPARSWRPAPYRFYRPAIPHGYRPFHGAPIIDRILGITFGTLFDASLSYLYTNGYYIDGYEDGVVYLRNVNMMHLNWDDVMLCYDDYNRLINAQFIYSTSYNDRSRYNRLYNELCASYGTPIDFDGRGYTWFGGNSVGYVTLSVSTSGSRFYTNLYIGS